MISVRNNLAEVFDSPYKVACFAGEHGVLTPSFEIRTRVLMNSQDLVTALKAVTDGK